MTGLTAAAGEIDNSRRFEGNDTFSTGIVEKV
jgi:hypothetical protein